MLTPKQKRLLDFIIEYTEREGCPPSLTDMMRGIDTHSTSSAQTLLRALEERGFISREKGARRSIRVLRRPEDAACRRVRFIPVHHCANCGDVIPFSLSDPRCPRDNSPVTPIRACAVGSTASA